MSIPQGKPWKAEALPPFPLQGAGYFTLLPRHSLVRGTIKMLLPRSLCCGTKLGNKTQFLA
ncbi:MAG: hypothetical protein CVV52_10910 [Spirochaetae bacterium HGW-Spirochaetae-8]|nr:MAG: hypothetical protein CVV52_10910 [Spirochaetae bacterium HGW-Spirochaetae-8]